MIRAILFDLDGTLLPMDTNKFRDAYVELIAESMPGLAPQQVHAAVDAALKAEMANRSPVRTNRDMFAQSVKQTHNIDWDTVEARLNSVWPSEFQRLRKMCPVEPLAAKIVHTANDKGLDCVLFDNPVRPLNMVRAMMKWADLTFSDFTLITSYETSTYTKPSPELFEQVMFSVGYAPDQCLAVGNDPAIDLLPAHEIGMETYLLTNYSMPYAGKPFWDREGQYEDLLDFMSRQ